MLGLDRSRGIRGRSQARLGLTKLSGFGVMKWVVREALTQAKVIPHVRWLISENGGRFWGFGCWIFGVFVEGRRALGRLLGGSAWSREAGRESGKLGEDEKLGEVKRNFGSYAADLPRRGSVATPYWRVDYLGNSNGVQPVGL
ncbi:hypothetical protein Droror1_Dr00020041 [Drosera rotundifolia]